MNTRQCVKLRPQHRQQQQQLQQEQQPAVLRTYVRKLAHAYNVVHALTHDRAKFSKYAFFSLFLLLLVYCFLSIKCVCTFVVGWLAGWAVLAAGWRSFDLASRLAVHAVAAMNSYFCPGVSLEGNRHSYSIVDNSWSRHSCSLCVLI